MTKILFFSSKLHRGGAEMHFIRLANALAEKGHQINVLSTQANGSFERLLRQDVILLPGTQNIRSYTLALIVSIFSLRRTLRKLQPEVVVSIQDGPNVAMLIACTLAGFKGHKVICVQNNPKTLEERLVGRWIFWIAKRLYAQADLIVSLSKGVGQEYVRQIKGLEGKIAVVPNIGFPDNQKYPVPAGKAIGSDLKLLAVGRLEPQKDYPTMIRGLQILKEKFKVPFQLTVLGNGSQLTAIEDLVRECNLQDRVDFAGFVEDTEIHYVKNDLLILTSRWEGFGNVIVEAMASGTPVVATDCPYGPGEIINSGTDGMLISVGDSNALAATIADIYGDPGLYKKLRTKGLERAGDFQSHIVGEKFKSLLETPQ
ncbi:MAG: glycosyltransferase [Bacteroidota bacterium]